MSGASASDAGFAADLVELRRTGDATQPFFAADDAVLARSYAPGKWTLRQFLVHLVDGEAVFLDRVRRLIADQEPLLLAFDENRWVDRLFADRRDLAAAGRLFAATRAALIELATLCPPELHAREGRHSERGTRSLAQVVRFVHQHNAHHLDQLAAITAGRPWTERADDPLAAHYRPR
jgi:uncharacterized damage-inducible protein DinB